MLQDHGVGPDIGEQRRCRKIVVTEAKSEKKNAFRVECFYFFTIFDSVTEA